MAALHPRGSQRQSRWLWVCGIATAALLVITPTTAGEMPSSAVASCSGFHMPINLLGYLWTKSIGEQPVSGA
jgi:hypothetical protein